MSCSITCQVTSDINWNFQAEEEADSQKEEVQSSAWIRLLSFIFRNEMISHLTISVILICKVDYCRH